MSSRLQIHRPGLISQPAARSDDSLGRGGCRDRSAGQRGQAQPWRRLVLAHGPPARFPRRAVHSFTADAHSPADSVQPDSRAGLAGGQGGRLSRLEDCPLLLLHHDAGHRPGDNPGRYDQTWWAWPRV